MYHLEFTWRNSGNQLQPPTKNNLLVFYLFDTAQRNAIAQKLTDVRYAVAEPENLY